MRWFLDKMVAVNLLMMDCDALISRWRTHTQAERVALYDVAGAICSHLLEVLGVVVVVWACATASIGLPVVIVLALVPPFAVALVIRAAAAWERWRTTREDWGEHNESARASTQKGGAA